MVAVLSYRKRRAICVDAGAVMRAKKSLLHHWGEEKNTRSDRGQGCG